MNPYKNGKIYRIVCNQSGKCYIGSTCKPLEYRLSQHVNAFNAYMKKCAYGLEGSFVSSYKTLYAGDFRIELLEPFPCESHDALLRREREFIETTECVNMRRPVVSREEVLEELRQYSRIHGPAYYKANCDKVKARSAQRYEANREDILAKHSCECGGRYSKMNWAIHKRSKRHQAFIGMPAQASQMQEAVPVCSQ